MSEANGWLLVWIQSLPIVWQIVIWTTLGLLFVGGVVVLAMVSRIYHVMNWDKPKIKITWRS
jgi:predicted membrane channel-forming protein YqfA (hemolysin III family)